MNAAQELMREAIQLQRAGRNVEAFQCMQEYTQTKPEDFFGWRNFAVGALRINNLETARMASERARQLRPEDAQIWFLSGDILQRVGDIAAAQQSYETAVRLDPNLAAVHNKLGLIHMDERRLSEAESAFRAAVSANPNYAQAWNNLAAAQLQLDRPNEAAASIRNALALEPNYSRAHLTLSAIQTRTGDLQAAQSSMRRAAESAPNKADEQVTLGLRLLEMREWEAAERALRQALKLDPRNFDACMTLGQHFADQGNRDAAVQCFEQALSIHPGQLAARIGRELTLPGVYSSRAALEEARSSYANGLVKLEAETSSYLGASTAEKLASVKWSNFYLAYQGQDDRELQTRFAKFQATILRSALPQYFKPIAPRPHTGRRLRVGFASKFFRRSTVGWYFKSWITRLDPTRFESFVFALDSRHDEIGQEIKAAAAHFSKCGIGVEIIAQSIRDAALDVLIYPEVGMDDLSFLLAGLRLAPLQCCGWGHPVTTGHANIDVYFSVDVMEPPDAAAHYTERLVRLPGIGTCYSRPKVPVPATRAELGLPEDATLMLIPQSLFKIHPDNDAPIAEILLRAPRSVAVLFEARTEPLTRQFVDRLSKQLSKRGLDPKRRIKVLPFAEHDKFLQITRACDFMLDSLHWSGGNTSLDAIACGLPIVTLPGNFMRGRQSAGMLKLMGIEELIATTVEDYVTIASRLATDADYRRTISAGVAEQSHLIFDQTAPIRAFEEFLLTEAR